MYRMVEQVEVQIAVQIEIEEGSRTTVRIVVQTITSRLFLEGPVFLVDVEFVVSAKTLDAHHGTDINVQPAVPVYIRHDASGIPTAFAKHSGLLTDVFELQISFVQVELVWPLVSGKEKIRQAVIVDVSDRDSTPVVVVQIIQDADVLVRKEVIAKVHPTFGRRPQFKELISSRTLGKKQSEKKNPPYKGESGLIEAHKLEVHYR